MRLCKWDGKTILRSSNDDIFSERARTKYNRAIDDLNDLRRNMVNNEEFMKQFNGREDFIEFFMFEAITRLASPITGEIYGTVATLSKNLYFKNTFISGALKRLDEKGMIELYEDGAKFSNLDDSTPLLRIMDTDECNYEQPTIRKLQLVS